MPNVPMYMRNALGQQAMNPQWIQYFRALNERVGGSTGSVVTSVDVQDVSTSPLFSSSGGPITTNGTIDLTLNTQPRNTLFMGPSSGNNAEPTFRYLANGDLPVVDIFHGGTNLSTSPLDGQLLIGDTNSQTYTLANITAGSGITVTNGPGSITISTAGVVSSVNAASTGTYAAALTISGVPITSTGTIDITPNVFSATIPGVVPSSGGGTTNYLRADGTWATPTGTITAINGTTNQINASTASGITTLSLSSTLITPGSVEVTGSLTADSTMTIVDTISGAGTTQHLYIYAPNNTNGANIELYGNGATTPSKSLRVQGGEFQILNSGYTASLVNISDTGQTTISGVGSDAQLYVNGPTSYSSEVYVAGNGNATSSSVLIQQDTANTGYIRNQAGTLYVGAGSQNAIGISTAGNVTVNMPTSGTALTVDGDTSISGALNMGGAIEMSPSGSAAAPGGWNFTNDTTTGMFQNGLGVIAYSSKGTFMFQITPSGVQVTDNVTINGSSSGVLSLVTTAAGQGPQILFSGASGTAYIGIDAFLNDYFGIGTTGGSALPIAFLAGGGLRMSISATGNVVVGAPSSGVAFTVSATAAGAAGVEVNSSATTGTQTATFSATNKPGTTTSGPTKWLPIVCDGVTYYMPLFS